jgi:hypothetical protein
MPPIQDAAHRIRYLRQFRSLIRGAESMKSFDLGVANIRSDLSAIPSDSVREEAVKRFGNVVGTSLYALERTPEQFVPIIQVGIDDLIAYLEVNDR